MADLGLKQAADAAWLKLQAALPIEMRAQAEFVRQRILVDARGWRDSGEQITSLPVLLEALWRGRRLRFDYAAAGDTASQRIVEPLGLVARGSIWYLVADRDDHRRTVPRLPHRGRRGPRGAEPPSRGLRPRGALGASRDEFRDKLPRFYATLLASRDALPRVRYYMRRVEEETDDGADRVRLRMRFDAEEEALQFALALGASVEVLEPAALRARVLATAESLVRRYGSNVTTPA
jgi:predicted DNA-binding transcriptional regulator YafY